MYKGRRTYQDTHSTDEGVVRGRERLLASSDEGPARHRGLPDSGHTRNVRDEPCDSVVMIFLYCAFVYRRRLSVRYECEGEEATSNNNTDEQAGAATYEDCIKMHENRVMYL